MGMRNIQRLKKKFNIKRNDGTTDKYFNFIDKVFYDKKIFTEEYNDKKDVMKWQFEDGKDIFMDVNEISNLLLFLMDLKDELNILRKNDNRKCLDESCLFKKEDY